MTVTGKPLLVAACENAIAMEKICLMLLEQGADVNAMDRVKKCLEVFDCSIYFSGNRKNSFACCLCCGFG